MVPFFFWNNTAYWWHSKKKKKETHTHSTNIPDLHGGCVPSKSSVYYSCAKESGLWSPQGRWELCREWTLCSALHTAAVHITRCLASWSRLPIKDGTPRLRDNWKCSHKCQECPLHSIALNGNKIKLKPHLEGWIWLSWRMGCVRSENHQRSYWASLATLSFQNKALFRANAGLTLLFWIHIVFVKIESSLLC